MGELTRRRFVRLGLGLGTAGLALTTLPEFLVSMPGQLISLGWRQVAALEQAIKGGRLESVPLRLDYLGAVRLADEPRAEMHYQVYQTSQTGTQQAHGALYFLVVGPAADAPQELAAPLHPHTPGQLSIQIQPFAADDLRYQRALPDGQVLRSGAQLAALRELFGGPRGLVTDPAQGRAHQIDLRPWLQEHPQRTYLNIAFYFRPA